MAWLDMCRRRDEVRGQRRSQRNFSPLSYRFVVDTVAPTATPIPNNTCSACSAVDSCVFAL